MNNVETKTPPKSVSPKIASGPSGQAHILDFFFILRPTLFFPGWTTLMAGFLAFRNQNVAFDSSSVYLFPPGDLIVAMVAFAMMMGSAFVLNQIKDAKNDRHNGKLFFISHGYMGTHVVLSEVAVLTVLPLFLSVAVGDYILLCLLSIFFVITGVLYNFEPFNLKNTAIAGLLANSLMGILAFSIGWFHGTPFSVEYLDWPLFQNFLHDVLPYALFNTAVYLLTTIPDHEGDRLDGKRTFSVRFGKNATVQLAVLLLGMSAVASWWVSDMVLLAPAMISLPFFGLLLFSSGTTRVIRAIKFSLFLFTVSLSIKFLFYLPLCFLFFFFSRWYYRTRFSIVYPNFGNR